MKTKTTKAPVVTIKTRAATAIAADIVKGLEGIENAKESAGAVYKEAAATMDGITTKWTLIKWNACKSPESTKAAFTAAGVTDSQGAKVAEFFAPIKLAVTEYDADAWKTVAQSIRRWSVGYIGSKPLHPDVKPAPADKPAPKADKPEPMTATTQDAVLANPQNARKVISELIAGLTNNMGLKVKNKMNVASIKEAIDLLGQADIALASMK